jgi:hypothetical protein
MVLALSSSLYILSSAFSAARTLSRSAKFSYQRSAVDRLLAVVLFQERHDWLFQSQRVQAGRNLVRYGDWKSKREVMGSV